MGQQAARLGDTAMTCNDPSDMPTGTVVAVGTVMINKMPAAKQNDQIIGVDIHIILIPSPGGPVPTPLPHPFSGMIDGGLSSSVNIMGMPAATVNSTANNMPPHIPQGGPFQKPPTNQAKIILGSPNVFIGNGGSGGGGGGGGGGNEQTAQANAAEPTEGHYIHAKYVDKGGKPIVGVGYKIKGPDGKEKQGILTGEIKQQGVTEGSHEISVSNITKAGWSSNKIKCGDTVKIEIESKGFKDGETAKIEIFRKDINSADMLYETFEEKVDGDKINIDWEFNYQLKENRPGVGKKKSSKYSMPSFYYVVTIGSIKSRSGILNVSDELKILLKDENGDPIADEEYKVYLPNGEIRQGKLDSDGKAVEKNVPAEKCRVVFPNIAGAKRLPE